MSSLQVFKTIEKKNKQTKVDEYIGDGEVNDFNS